MDFGGGAALSPSMFKLTGRMKQDFFSWPEVEGDANIHGPLSFAVPSSAAGYAHMHRTWGRLPLAEVMAPAIALARRGLPQDWYTTLKVSTSAAVLRRYPESARIYLPNGLPPIAPYQGTPGFFRLGALPDTLEHLARAGLRDLYEGEVAAALLADVRDLGGVLSAEDLRLCRAGGVGDGGCLAEEGVAAGRRADDDAGAGADAFGVVRRGTRYGLVCICGAADWAGRRGPDGGGDLHHASDGV